MSDMVQNAERDFWTPPIAPPPISAEATTPVSMVEACDQCETEFIPGAKFCHVCGTSRASQPAGPSAWATWRHRAVQSLRSLDFRRVERWIVSVRHALGLSVAALIAFAVGLACVIGAIGVGLVFTVQTTLDWQAVQVWRMEWLLAASASFLAGILLKKSEN